MSFGYSQALGGESAPPDHTRARGVHALVALGEELDRREAAHAVPLAERAVVLRVRVDVDDKALQ